MTPTQTDGDPGGCHLGTSPRPKGTSLQPSMPTPLPSCRSQTLSLCLVLGSLSCFEHYIFVCVHTCVWCVYMSICVYARACVSMCVSVYVSACIYVCVHVCVWVSVCMCVHLSMCVCIVYMCFLCVYSVRLRSLIKFVISHKLVYRKLIPVAWLRN